MYPVLVDFGTLRIGGFAIPIVLGGYGLMFSLAIVAAWLWVRKLGREIDPTVPWTDAYFGTIIAGVIGAKITNLLVFLPDVLDGRVSIFGAMRGGGVWLGGVIFGLAAWFWTMRGRSVRLGLALNALFVGIPFGHAIGRVGCFLGGCCYGAPCDRPWAVIYTDPIAHKVNGTPLHVPLHPTVLYEAGLEMGNFAVCYTLWRRKAGDWVVFLAWAGLYGTERFFLEFLRNDRRGLYGPFSTSQWISLALIAAAIGFLVRLRRRAA